MRITIRIDEDLYLQAKAAASREGHAVSQLIEDAVRTALQPRSDVPGNVEDLPVFGGSGLLPGVDLDDRRSLLDVMGQGVSVGALR
ncbi:MAG: CopG family transcriptional regulator [Microthrixaceae bacterium]|nr:CopG family transcriptional regulator [Microthrixaceae bacterium]